MAYLEHVLIFLCIYIILSVSLNLVIGFTGLLNLGHAAFYAIGAYVSALLLLNGLPFWIALMSAAIVAGFFGFLIGLPTLKLKGDYLAIATLGFLFIIESVLKNWRSLTRGPMGLPGIPHASFIIEFNSQIKILLLALFFAVLTIFVINRLVRSPFGRILTAIREDEIAVKALGKNVFKFKAIALVVSAGFAGVAGSLYASYIQFIDPSSFTFIDSVFIICMVVLGGLGSIRGSIAGAIILIFLPESLRFLDLPNETVGALRLMLFSTILILLMLFRPRGIFGERRLKVRDNA